MRLREELRLADKVNRESIDAVAGTRPVSLRDLPVLLAILVPFAAVMVAAGYVFGLEGPVGAMAVIIVVGLVYLEFRTAYWVQRSHRMGSGLRTAVLGWLAASGFWGAMLGTVLAQYMLHHAEPGWHRWGYLVAVGAMAILALLARLAGALVAEWTEPRSSA